MDTPRKNNDCYFYYYSTCLKVSFSVDLLLIVIEFIVVIYYVSTLIFTYEMRSSNCKGNYVGAKITFVWNMVLHALIFGNTVLKRLFCMLKKKLYAKKLFLIYILHIYVFELIIITFWSILKHRRILKVFNRRVYTIKL